MPVTIQTADFDVSAEIALASGHDTGIGGIATFVGKMRGVTDGKPLQSMILEHYPGMTETELSHIADGACARFKLSAVRIIHRIGTLKPGDNIVLVIACAPHRQDAFDGCTYLMDYLKTTAPFWKKEVGLDGRGEWVDASTADSAAASRWQSGSSTPRG